MTVISRLGDATAGACLFRTDSDSDSARYTCRSACLLAQILVWISCQGVLPARPEGVVQCEVQDGEGIFAIFVCEDIGFVYILII